MCNVGDRLLHPQGQLQVLDLQAVSSEGERSGFPDDKRSTCSSGSLPGPVLVEPVVWAGCDLSAGDRREQPPGAPLLSPEIQRPCSPCAGMGAAGVGEGNRESEATWGK